MGRYRGHDLEAILGASLGSTYSGGGMWFSMPKGEYNVIHNLRVLPALDDEPYFWVEHCQHFKRQGTQGGSWSVPGEERGKAITCLEVHKGIECPVDFLRKKLGSNHTIAKSVEPTIQFYINVIDMDDADHPIKIWGAPYGVINEIRNFMANPKIKDLCDPEDGRDLSIMRAKSPGGKVSYNVQYDPDRSAIVRTDWETEAHKLRDLISYFTQEEIIEIIRHNFGRVLDVDELFMDFPFDNKQAEVVAPVAETPARRGRGRK